MFATFLALKDRGAVAAAIQEELERREQAIAARLRTLDDPACVYPIRQLVLHALVEDRQWCAVARARLAVNAPGGRS